MNENQKNDLFYVCSMIEFVARKTKNHRKDIVLSLGRKGLEHQLKVASVNHSLSFEQVSDEWIEDYQIEMGNFDTIKNCKYSIPSETSIGSVYQTLILSILKNDDIVQEILNVFYTHQELAFGYIFTGNKIYGADKLFSIVNLSHT